MTSTVRRASRSPFNNREVFLHKGDLTVETLKRLAGILLTDDLDQLVGSKIVHCRTTARSTSPGAKSFSTIRRTAARHEFLRR